MKNARLFPLAFSPTKRLLELSGSCKETTGLDINRLHIKFWHLYSQFTVLDLTISVEIQFTLLSPASQIRSFQSSLFFKNSLAELSSLAKFHHIHHDFRRFRGTFVLYSFAKILTFGKASSNSPFS